MTDPIPPGHGEPEPGNTGGGSNVQDAWAFDPAPLPPIPTEEIDF
jgi:hypothetical protein